jgi:hypothetical protein
MRLCILYPLCVMGSTHTNRKRNREDDLQPVSNQSPFPSSNAAAQAEYLHQDSCAFDRVDTVLVERVPPSASLWQVHAERVPGYIFSEEEIRFEPTPLGVSDYSIVYAISEHRKWAIKYHSFCPSVDEPFDSVLRENYFLGLLRRSGISHKVRYMSTSFVPTTDSEIKLPFRNVECPENPGKQPVVRFLITERVGSSLWKHIRSGDGLDYREVLIYAREIFALLQKLHAMKIVHGDIHSGNIVFRAGDIPLSSLLLMDFGKAVISYRTVPRRLPDVNGDLTRIRIFCHPHNSPWESVDGMGTISYRDDVFRALLVMGEMMYGDPFLDIQHILCEDEHNRARLSQYMDFKRSENFFDLGIARFSLEEVLPDTYTGSLPAIREAFVQLLALVRDMTFAEPPDYAQIFSLIDLMDQ